MKNSSKVNIPLEEELEDEIGSNTDDGGYERNIGYNDNGKIKEGTSKMKMSPKLMLVAMGAVALVIVLIIFKDKLPLPEFNIPSASSEETTEEGGGGVSGMIDAFDEAGKPVEGGGEGGEEGAEAVDTSDPVAMMMADLQEYYPNYEIVRDDGTQTINITGIHEGQNHKVVMDFEANILEDELTPVGQSVSSEGGAEGEPKKDTVEVKESIYKKSLISKDVQTMSKPVEESADGFSEMVVTNRERVIVEYEKLPIQGKFTTLYAVVLDTGEELIFPVTLEQYATLPNKGSNVVEITRAEGYGVSTINSVDLVNWQ